MESYFKEVVREDSQKKPQFFRRHKRLSDKKKFLLVFAAISIFPLESEIRMKTDNLTRLVN